MDTSALIVLFLMALAVAFMVTAMIKGFQVLAQLPGLATIVVLGIAGTMFFVWIGSDPEHNTPLLLAVLQAALDLSKGFISAFKWVLSHLKLK